MSGMKSALTLMMLVLSVSVGSAHAEGRISVTGEGRVFAVPDMAILTMGSSAENKSAKEAMDQTSAITLAILDQLATFEVAPRDIQTSDLSLTPVWSNQPQSDGRPRIEGYQASNRLTVRIRNLDQLGGILDAVLSDGANRLGGLQFTVADPKPMMDEARRLAVLDAREKATLYADAAGVVLGDLVSLNENGARLPRPEMMSMARAADAGVPVAEGETELRAGVTLVYEIATP